MVFWITLLLRCFVFLCLNWTTRPFLLQLNEWGYVIFSIKKIYFVCFQNTLSTKWKYSWKKFSPIFFFSRKGFQPISLPIWSKVNRYWFSDFRRKFWACCILGMSRWSWTASTSASRIAKHLKKNDLIVPKPNISQFSIIILFFLRLDLQQYVSQKCIRWYTVHTVSDLFN